MKRLFTNYSVIHRGWVLLLVLLLSCTSLLAATRTKVLGEVLDKAPFSSGYDTGNDWWGYQIYKNSRLNINLSSYKKDVSPLVLSFRMYVQNLDHPGQLDFLTQKGCNGFLELGKSISECYTFDPTKLNLKEGWNDIDISFKDMGVRSDYTLEKNITCFRICYAHFKTNDAYIMRIADVCIKDKNQTEEVEEKEEPTYETNYEVCSLPFSFDATVTKASANGLKGIQFPTSYDLSKHNVKQLYVAFDSEITLSDGANISTIANGNGQIELTSSGKCDNEEATIGMNKVEWKEGKHTYYVALQSVLGGLNVSNLNYMRVYLTRLENMVGTIHWTMDNVRILDFTNKASMPTVFSDGMMFQQNKSMNIWGYGAKGKTIKIDLSKNGTVIATKETTLTEDGKWTIAFDAQKGSYDKYSFTAYEDGEAFQTVKDILVGDIWISGGQSNMALNVNGLQNRDEVLKEANTEYVRFFMEPNDPTNGVSPYESEKDIPGAKWGYGNNQEQVKTVSAVAYLTVKELQKKQNIPVGFINTAIGSSIIEAWIGRDVVEDTKNADMKKELYRRSLYFDKDFWPNGASTITGYYNAKIGPLKGFNIAGGIWYQGESNSGRPELYARELQMLKESWANTFNMKVDEMPFFYNGLATWVTDTSYPYWLALMAEAMEDGLRVIGDQKTGYYPIYDTNYDYTGNVIIHPTDKSGVAHHHATSIYNMLYSNGTKEYLCPMKESVTAKDGKMVVKFNHVGEGLKTIDGLKEVHGFTIADEDGIYVGACAKITGKDEVTVWNDGVKNPKYVNYAFCSFNMESNLANSEDFPASPFRSERTYDYTTLEGKNEMKNKYYNPQPWTYADAAQTWEISKEKETYYLANGSSSTEYATAYRDTWTTNPVSGEAKATFTFDTDVKAEGKASIKLTYDGAGEYGVGPVSGYQSRVFQFGNFKTLSVMVKNADEREKKLQLSFKSGDAVYTVLTDQTIKASSDFQTLSFDLTLLKDEKGAMVANATGVLKAASDVQFTVTDNAAGTVYLDNIMFGTYAEDEDLVDGEIRVVGKDASNQDIVKIRRDLKGGEWNVITLPFQLNKPDKTEFATYFGEGAQMGCLGSGAKVEGDIIVYSPRGYNDDMVAGRPYFIKPAKDVKVVITKARTTTGTQTVSASGTAGNYSAMGTLAERTLKDNEYLLKGDGTFYHPTGDEANLIAMSGYFTFPAGVDVSKLTINDTATGITGVEEDEVSKNAKIYTLGGQYVGTDVQTLAKGIYVIRNKKVVIK